MELNITVSSWPGSGATALALILTKIFKYKLVQGGQTFRLLSTLMGKEDTGFDRIQIDEFLEKYYGKIFDSYVDHLLVNQNSLIIESDIASFRVGKTDKIFSIFLISSLEARTQRLKGDSREKDIKFLSAREKSLQKEYLNLYNIDWLDINTITKTHSLVLDNSSITIEEEIYIILDELLKKGFNNFQYFKSKVGPITKSYIELGKIEFMRNLEKDNLLYPTKQLIKDVINFSYSEFKSFPTKLKEIFEML